MKTKTTEIKGEFIGGQLAIVMHKKGSFWIATYMSKVFRSTKGYDLFSHAKKFRTITAIKALFNDLGLIYKGNKTISLTMPSNRSSARAYAYSRRSYNNKKLAVWLTPIDFERLDKKKKDFKKRGLIEKATQEQVIRFLLKMEL